MAGALPVVLVGSPAERLASLFDVHHERLYRLARRLAPSADDALDLVQETFLKAARFPKSIPIGTANEEAWLVRVLINIRRDQWRKTSVRNHYDRAACGSSYFAIGDRDPETALIAKATVWEALNVLPPRRRAIVVMYELEGLAIPAVAALLGISVITVRWHLSRGRRELTGALGRIWETRMKTIRELLQDADPLQHEPAWPSSQRDFHRQAVIAAASAARAPGGIGSRSRIAAFATVASIAVAAPFLGSRGWSLFVSDLGAAVRFEVRLAEERPAPGLRAVKVSGSERSIYLHNEVVVSNSDIAAARLVQGGPTQYSVGIEFNASGAEKIRVATEGHIGKPVAILLDGQVVMAPLVRASLGASAVITGNFTKTQAERIVKGIGVR